MGYSLSWVAVKADPQAVYAALDLQPTGRRQANFSLPRKVLRRPKQFCGATLPGGWIVVVADHWALEDGELPAVSRVGEAVYCFVEEHVMVTIASLWRNGKQIWRVIHDGQEGMNHLLFDGDIPPEFASIRDKYLAKQEMEREEDVDHIFDIPVELARELTGFRHDQELLGTDDGEPFEVLETIKKKRWWSLA